MYHFLIVKQIKWDKKRSYEGMILESSKFSVVLIKYDTLFGNENSNVPL